MKFQGFRVVTSPLRPKQSLRNSRGSSCLAVAWPLQELALEPHSRVYIAGEIIGAGLLLWDLARKRTLKH